MAHNLADLCFDIALVACSFFRDISYYIRVEEKLKKMTDFCHPMPNDKLKRMVLLNHPFQFNVWLI